MGQVISKYFEDIIEKTSRIDKNLANILVKEIRRQQDTLALVASCSLIDKSILSAESIFLDNVTAEGYPYFRYHAGCKFIDEIESIAIDNACKLFKAKYANVQPLSASIANQIVFSSLLEPGDTIMGLKLDSGGHLSHGSKVNISSKFYNSISYGIKSDGHIDFDQLKYLVEEHSPKLIVAGTTAYPRTLDFEKFRKIADLCGAYLLADITHIAGLVAAGEHPSPIDIAHVTTLCTHKQLYGPRGGLILSGIEYQKNVKDNQTLSQRLNRGVFPLFQGAPALNKILAKALIFKSSRESNFIEKIKRVKKLAFISSEYFKKNNIKVLFNGTDNHIVIIDVLSSFGVTGIVAQKALEECGIIVNKNIIPNDSKLVTVGSGIRLGTNNLAARGITSEAMHKICDLIIRILNNIELIDDYNYKFKDIYNCISFKDEIVEIARSFPLPGYYEEE
ncbi:MAG: serine hydroxymethyltransferase [Cardiobacteriaceae bacterium]|nr:serine hydroxymethyltransferase [Cardiobacteriaceae bacterium]